MSTLHGFASGTFLAAIAVLWTGELHAQQFRQQPQRPQMRQPQQAGQEGQSAMVGDKEMAVCLVIDNLSEIKLSKMGVERAENEEVRQYAQKMVQAHLEEIQKIMQAGFGEQVPEQLKEQIQAVHNRREEQQQQQQPERQQHANNQQGQVSFIQLRMALANHMENIIRQNMQQKRGHEFDVAFMQCQIGSHQYMLASLHTLRQFASPKLQQVVNAAIQPTQAHLQEAQTILRQLEQRQPATARQPQREPQR